MTPPGKSRRSGPTTVQSLDNDILCMVFSLLDLFEAVRCTAVCKSWNAVINRYKLLQALCCKLQQDFSSFSHASTSSQQPVVVDLEQVAMKHHKSSLQKGEIDIDQWKGHTVGVDQCRMRMGLVLTGVGDKVMRLWSLDSYTCIEEFSVPDTVPLVDFDFDENKVVGLLGTRICIWRRNGKRSLFPSHEGTFPKGLCMRYYDPDAVVGCEDGTVRTFDMYSRKCSQIIRMHAGPVTCLSLGDDQLIVSGGSHGNIAISDPLSDQRVMTLRSTYRKGGIRTLCYNPTSHLVFSGTTAGFVSCWDIRKLQQMWERRVSPNVVYSVQHLRNDTSSLAVGGIDGVLRVLSQNSGDVIARCMMDDNTPQSSSGNEHVIISRKGRRLLEESRLDRISRSLRPPITCLAVGMKKVVTTHRSKHISIWKFHKSDNAQN